MKVEKKIKRVLIIDDEEEIRKFLGKTLKEKAYETDTTKNAETALEKIKSNDYDALIIDIMLPKMDGIELLKNIKKLGKNIATLMITGYPDTKKAVSAIKLGAFDYIEKPIDIEHLENRLNNAIKIKELEKIEHQQRKIFSSKEFEDNLLNNIPYQIVLVNNDLEVIYANEVFLKHIRAADMIGKKVLELVPRDVENIEQVESKVKKVLTSKQPIYERKVKFNISSGEFYINAQYIPFQQNYVAIFIRNITKQVKSEKEIERIKEEYRRLAENAPMGFSRIDARTQKYDLINKEFERQSGYTLDEFNKLSREEHKEIIHPQDRDRVDRIFEQWKKTGYKDTLHLTYRIFHRKGNIVWIDNYLFADKDENDEVIAVNQISIDITDKKRREESEKAQNLINKERAKLLSDLRQIDDIDRVLKRACECIRDSQLYKRAVMTLHNDKKEIINLGQVGLDPKIVEQARNAPPPDENLIKKMKSKKFCISRSIFIPTEAGIDFLSTQRYIKQDENIIGDNLPKDSVWQEEDALFTPLHNINKEIMGYLSVDTPFDGRRPDEQKINILESIVEAAAGRIREIQTLKNLEESERKYQDLYDNAPEMYFTVDKYGIIKSVNKLGASQLGYTVNELIGKSVLTVVHPEDKLLMERQINNIVKNPGRIHKLEFRKVRKDGSIIYVSERMSSLRDAKSDNVLLRIMCRDITEQKKLEEQASRAERLRTAGEIAGQIAHDCNNLLTPIMAYPDYIKMYLPKGHKVIKFVDQIKESARRIADINQDLLTLSRRGHYEQVLLNLNDIVNQILSEQESYPNLVIEKSLEPNLFLIKGGTFQLKRVLINLINNARESMENIGTLTIITKNVYLDKMLMGYNNIARGEYVKISINDNGCGIPEENIRKIFTPFFTTKKADKKRGSGLGLSVVNSIVQDHNGFIDIKSQVGVGTNFDIYFPICRECIKEDVKKSKLIGGNERILIVDDDELQCKVALFILKELGYQVDFVLSGEEAVEYIKDNPCDLLIIDMVMDGIDGAETYCRIKKLYSNQRAIIVSGFAKTERVIQAQNMGAGKYIRKPITRDKLGRAVREELDA